MASAYRDGNPDQARSAGLLARIDGVAVAPQERVVQANLPTNDNQWATSPAVTQQLDMIAADDMTPTQKVEHLIWTALGRRASPEELEHARIVMESASDPRTALQDIWWGLLNSVEYQIPLDLQ